MSTPNAYQSPAYVPVEPKPGVRQLQYMEMFTFWFSSPNWGMNLLWASLCVLVGGVPILGLAAFMVLEGYLWECVEQMHRRSHRTYLDFDPNQIMSYLQRGLWPFLISIVVFVLQLLVLIPLVIAGVIITIALGDKEFILGVVAGLVLFLMSAMAAVLSSIVSLPMMLRAGLSQDVGQALRFGWVLKFVKTMWFELILGWLVWTIASFMAIVVGMILVVGVYPAQALAFMSGNHLLWQLYEIYLERGGEPIPLKPVDVSPGAQAAAMR